MSIWLFQYYRSTEISDIPDFFGVPKLMNGEFDFVLIWSVFLRHRAFLFSFIYLFNISTENLGENLAEKRCHILKFRA